MRVYFATTNPGKVNTFGKVFEQYGHEIVEVKMELPEPRTEDINKIAIAKVKYAYEKLKSPCFAHDSGFYLHALGGYPGSYVNSILKNPKMNIPKILKLMEGEPREAGFLNTIAYLDSTLAEPMCFTSSIEGRLSEQPMGTLKEYSLSDLHLIFIPEGCTKTMADMTREEYFEWRTIRQPNSVASKFGEWLSSRETPAKLFK